MLSCPQIDTHPKISNICEVKDEVRKGITNYDYDVVYKVPNHEFSYESSLINRYLENELTGLPHVLLVNTNHKLKRIELHLTPIVASA